MKMRGNDMLLGVLERYIWVAGLEREGVYHCELSRRTK